MSRTMNMYKAIQHAVILPASRFTQALCDAVPLTPHRHGCDTHSSQHKLCHKAQLCRIIRVQTAKSGQYSQCVRGLRAHMAHEVLTLCLMSSLEAMREGSEEVKTSAASDTEYAPDLWPPHTMSAGETRVTRNAELSQCSEISECVLSQGRGTKEVN